MASVGFGTYPYGEPFTPGGKNSFGKLSQTPQISDNVTKIHGRPHSQGRRLLGLRPQLPDQRQFEQRNPRRGRFRPLGTFNHQHRQLPWPTSSRPALTASTQDNAEAVQDMKYNQYSFFFNDQWKASRRLTLTGGLRFEHMGNWVPNDNYGVAVWDPATYNNTSSAPAYTGLEWHSIDPSIPSSGFPNKSLFIEPRFGFAYDIFGNGKTVIRGGAGLFRFQIAYNNASAGYNQPLGLVIRKLSTANNAAWAGISSRNIACVGCPRAGYQPSAHSLWATIRRRIHWTYNVTISQRVPWRSVAEFQYAGNRSRDLLSMAGIATVRVAIDMIPLGAFFGTDPITGQNLYKHGGLLTPT